MKGHVSVINTLLQKGENVDAVTNVSKDNWFGFNLSDVTNNIIAE